MKKLFLASSCLLAGISGVAAAEVVSPPLKRDIHGITLGMTIEDVEGLKLKNCQAGSRVSIYCNDGQYSIRLSDKRRIYEITISPCTTYTCKELDSSRLLKQLEADYAVRLDSLAGKAYYGKRSDLMVAFSFSDDLWHIGIIDQKIQMDDSALK
jgi:hypothetical protein